ncbi:manganese-dependent inorganic pyrophosphatase [Streptohalobacillus salinus]|uniref:Probable manganese-dependent inorganic pyrophosphatase n=1 Tax=Streptohalobacillus salinus TaxID=621096 RepID=A0A2V3WEA5_9BACI|nr:manganese-dependent inorganic pyrophosphatase [Streptohalobacillus salinus]PXW91836.1 manganese-dependent inorganic pyrophosphatase [Streptohalobacillus salinus]
MSKTLIFGHKNPDTDTIASAISYAYLKEQLNEEAEAVRLGDVNKETAFALEYFNQAVPRMVDTVANEVSQVILVDHNEMQQSVIDLDKVTIKEVIDHHRIANFETNEPLYYRAEPVGCTATILNKLFKEHNVAIPKAIAGLMLSAIVSDSLLFKSPTCTDQDISAAKELADIAEVDIEIYGLELLKAGADLSDKSVEDLLLFDAKAFKMGSSVVEIGQVNTVDPEELLLQKDAIKSAITERLTTQKLDLFVFVITNILTNDSIILTLGAKQDAVEQAFHVTLVDDVATLPGVVSRKKQIVPQLTEALS